MAGRLAACFSTAVRCTFKVRANASIEDNNRFCSEVITSIAVVWVDLAASLSRSSRKLRYCCSNWDNLSSGASSGRWSITIGLTKRWGNSSPISRKSCFKRRTITVSSNLWLRTGTPRQKRWGSRISSKAAKLLECPLWGVADKNSLCSKRGAKSRTVLVSWESTAYFAPLAGAALWASSRMSMEAGEKSLSQSRNGAA